MSLKVQALLPAAELRTRVTVPLRFAGAGRVIARPESSGDAGIRPFLPDAVAGRIIARPEGSGDAGIRPFLPDAGAYETVADVFTFTGLADGKEHLALGLGDYRSNPIPLVRPHSECLTGDVFGSERCDCGPQLREAVERISGAGGFLLYLRQEGRGIGLYAKLDAYALQDAGLDTYAANRALGHGDDERDYTAAAQMLGALGATKVKLLTNNPDKVAQLEELGITVDEQVATGVHLSPANARYLRAKVDHTGHTLAL